MRFQEASALCGALIAFLDRPAVMLPQFLTNPNSFSAVASAAITGDSPDLDLPWFHPYHSLLGTRSSVSEPLSPPFSPDCAVLFAISGSGSLSANLIFKPPNLWWSSLNSQASCHLSASSVSLSPLLCHPSLTLPSPQLLAEDPLESAQVPSCLFLRHSGQA
jgi:hypothetical protein